MGSVTSGDLASRDGMDRTRWIARFPPRPRARLRLFCVPYAGGSASAYRTWFEGLPATVEVCAVQLPGRETRYTEPLLTDARAAAGALADAIAPLLDRPFAFFGHSLGALVAWETVLALGRQRAVAPAVLFVSGHRAPHLPRDVGPIHDLPETLFVDELRRLNGTPVEVFADRELLRLVLPQLRADFRMAETYVPAPAGPLSCSVVALGGSEDERTPRRSLEAWREVTTGPFDVRLFPGDHFYFNRHRATVLGVVAGHLVPHLG